jgi:hypothetical protein
MEPFTIFLDTHDPKQTRFFWIIQSFLCLVWTVQGARVFYDASERTSWLHWIQLIGGLCVFIFLVYHYFQMKNNDRPRLVFHDDGLEIKAKANGQVKQLTWQEIGHIHIKINEVEIVPKTSDAIQIGLDSYVINQQVKQNLQRYASEKEIEIAE